MHGPAGAGIARRADCFDRAGLGLGDAMLLALRRDVDREQVERMLAAGATAAQVRL